MAPLNELLKNKNEFNDHAKAVREILNCIYWIFNGNMPVQFIEMTVESSEF